MSDDDKNETLLGMRAIADGDEPTEKQKLAVENHMRFFIGLRRFIEYVVDYWKQLILGLIGLLIGAFSFRDSLESFFKTIIE